jgi:hypothetical protein
LCKKIQNPKIQVDISANAVNLKKGIDEAGAKITELSGLAEGLSGVLGAAFGATTIALGVEKMFDFADATIKGASALGVQIKQFEALKILANETGTSMDTLDSAINKIGASADEALSGNAEKLQAFRYAGINQQDIKNTPSDFNLLEKVLANTQGESRSQIESILRGLGIRKPGELMPAVPGLSNFGSYQQAKEKAGELADPEQLRQLQLLKIKFNDLADEIQTKMVPVLIWAIDKIQLWVSYFKLGWATISNIIDYGISLWQAKFENALLPPDSKDRVDTNQLKRIYEKTDELNLKNYKKEESDRKSKEKAEMDAFKQQQNEIGQGERGTTTQHNTNFGSNQYLKVGGLMGVDVNVRLHQLTQNIAEFTKQTAANTKIIASHLMGEGTGALKNNKPNWHGFIPPGT